ncbi:MAG: hypothetical protein WCO09_01430 [bacterium]
METKTLIIGFVPLDNIEGKKPRQIKEDEYFKELFSQFDLGEVHYCFYKDWIKISDEINPLFIIYLGGEYTAREVHERKPDSLLYVTYDAGQIFYRKAEMEEKKLKQIQTLTEVSDIINRIRAGEYEIEFARKFSAMSYDDLYKMIIKAITSDDEKLRKDGWDILMNSERSDFIWMRAQLLMETWNMADSKGKEKFLCLAMDQHIDNGLAKKLADFTDLDGQQYHQYMFYDYIGNEINCIRRIPFATKGQDKSSYEAMLNTYEIPNGVRMMYEASLMKNKKDEYLKTESDKIISVLKSWKEDPTRSKKELGVVPWDERDSNEDPLTGRELSSMKRFLERNNKEAYEDLFGSPDLAVGNSTSQGS